MQWLLLAGCVYISPPWREGGGRREIIKPTPEARSSPAKIKIHTKASDPVGRRRGQIKKVSLENHQAHNHLLLWCGLKIVCKDNTQGHQTIQTRLTHKGLTRRLCEGIGSPQIHTSSSENRFTLILCSGSFALQLGNCCDQSQLMKPTALADSISALHNNQGRLI